MSLRYCKFDPCPPHSHSSQGFRLKRDPGNLAGVQFEKKFFKIITAAMQKGYSVQTLIDQVKERHCPVYLFHFPTTGESKVQAWQRGLKMGSEAIINRAEED